MLTARRVVERQGCAHDAADVIVSVLLLGQLRQEQIVPTHLWRAIILVAPSLGRLGLPLGIRQGLVDAIDPIGRLLFAPADAAEAARLLRASSCVSATSQRQRKVEAGGGPEVPGL